ncbi:SH3 domain-containing kinase-binding protein 1-like isoform X1 [Tachypleus tridentatus]|uniref:SH3 domain-containing kinase-binding protein 1-like isoform X1 n=1 Tax=Tachypleus tridentatus TaxID=6853 RepID=UPI003FD16ECC
MEVESPTATNAGKTTAKRGRARALYSYTPVNDDELQLQVDDIIEVLDEVEEGWWKGMLKGLVGVFPSNFVVEEDGNGNVFEPSGKTEKESEINNDPRTVAAPPKNSLPNSPTQEEVKPKPVHGIGYGNIFKDGIVNLKPTCPAKRNPSFQKKLELPTDSDAPKLPPKPVKELVKVLFSYEAQNEDELTIQEGDIITIVTKDVEDKGWWKGELNGKIGVFPDNFVEVLKADEAQSRKPERPEKPAVAVLATNVHSTTQTNAPSCIVDSPITEKVTKKGTASSKISPPAIPKKEDKPAPPLPGKKPLLQSKKKPQRSSVSPVKPSTLLTPQTSSILMSSASTASIPGTSKLPSPSVASPSGSTPIVSPVTTERLTDDMKVRCQQQKPEDKSAFDSVEVFPDKLTHLTASRAKAPNRRPPSQFLGRETGKENGDLLGSEQPPWLCELLKSQSKRASQCYAETKDIKETSPNKEAKTGILPAKVNSSKFSLISTKDEDNKSKIKPVPSPTLSISAQSSPSTHCPSSFNLDVVTLQQEVDNLKKEMNLLKSTSVNKGDYNDLQKQVKQLEDSVEMQRKHYSKFVVDLMKEVDEEKKLRMALQVELDRIKKLTSTV